MRKLIATFSLIIGCYAYSAADFSVLSQQQGIRQNMSDKQILQFQVGQVMAKTRSFKALKIKRPTI